MKGKKSVVVVLVALLVIVGTGVGAHVMLAGSDQPRVEQSEGGPPAVRVTPAEPSSVAEAEAMIGAAIPVPAYLPSSYGIQRIFVYEDGAVVLMFSDGVITDPSLEAIPEPTFWEDEFKRPDGARLVIQIRGVDEITDPETWEEIAAGRARMPGEVVEIGPVKALLGDPAAIQYPTEDDVDPRIWGGEVSRPADIWYLSWCHSMLQFDLKAPKALGRDEVIKIASSVPVLSCCYFKEVSLEEAESIVGVAIPEIKLPAARSQRVFVWGDSAVYLVISDIDIGRVETESQFCDLMAKPDEQTGAKVILRLDTEIPQFPVSGIDPLQVSPGEGEILEFDGQRAIFWERVGYHDVEWYTQDCHFRLRAVEQLSVGDLAEIITSRLEK